MSKKMEVVASAQTSFGIYNWESNEKLSLTPPLYQKLLFPEGIQYEIIDEWGIGVGGGLLSTSTRKDKYNARIGYIPISQSILLEATSTNCQFDLAKQGDQITYSSSTQDGTIKCSYVLYEDIVGAVMLMIKDSSLEHHEQKKIPESRHSTHYITENEYAITEGKYSKGSNSITIQNTEMFSFLQNVNLYFPNPIYQLIGGTLTEISSLPIDSMGKFGGFFSLTNNTANLYPEGTTVITVEDGLSEGSATIEFNHNLETKTVKITVISHTSKVCDFRDLREVGYDFPNTLCFAL